MLRVKTAMASTVQALPSLHECDHSRKMERERILRPVSPARGLRMGIPGPAEVTATGLQQPSSRNRGEACAGAGRDRGCLVISTDGALGRGWGQRPHLSKQKAEFIPGLLCRETSLCR